MVRIRLAQVVNLIFLERGDKSALMLLQDQLGNEFADSLDIEQVDNVDLMLQLL